MQKGLPQTTYGLWLLQEEPAHEGPPLPLLQQPVQESRKEPAMGDI